MFRTWQPSQIINNAPIIHCSYPNILGKHSTKQNCSKTSVSWPLSPPRKPALLRGFDARSTFRPLRSGPDQAHHLPGARFGPPATEKRYNGDRQGVPHFTHNIPNRLRYIIQRQMAAHLIVVFLLFQLKTPSVTTAATQGGATNDGHENAGHEIIVGHKSAGHKTGWDEIPHRTHWTDE